MSRTLAAAVAALTLWCTACGITASEEGSADAGPDAAAVDVRPGADPDDRLDVGEDPQQDPGSDGSDEADDSDDGDDGDESSGGAESDESDDSEASDDSEGSGTPSGGITPGEYVAPDGAVENGYGLRFEVSDDGAVLHSLEADVLESCDGSSTTNTVTVGADLAWDIVDGQFSARYEEDLGGGTLYTTLEGSFSGTSASGTIRQESVVAGSVCDTYALEFTAELR